MKNQRLLNPSVTLLVSLLHAGLIAAGWQAAQPAEPVTVDNLTFIDLGSPEGDNRPKAEGAPAPLPETPQTAPPKPEQPKPKQAEPRKAPAEPAEAPVKTVVRNDVKPDLAAPKPKEPQPQPLPQAQSQPDPAPRREQEQKPAAEPPRQVTAPAAGGSPNAANRSADAPADGGGGTDPNSKVPQNSGGGSKGAEGKGAKGPGGGNEGGGQGGNSIVDGGYVTLPMPPYPQLAMENGDEGTVRVEVIVEANGRISSAKVVKSSGSTILNNAALKAARSANIKPKMINGEPVRSRFITPFNFKLN